MALVCSSSAMSERLQPQQVRVFVSSPGDVADERALTCDLLKKELPYDPFLRNRVVFDVVSWDDPAAPIPMDAAITPQEAVNRFGRKPSECDVVVVVLWSRMGTHLDVKAFPRPNGGTYRSGTEWEFEDALNASGPQRPVVLVYRRAEEFRVGVKDPEWAEKFRQFHLVEEFLGSFRNPDGSFRRTFTSYDEPMEFKERLAKDLRHLVYGRLAREPPGGDAAPAAAAAPPYPGPPYPGLRPFTSDEAPIFFGRGREVDALVARLRDPARRFLAVVGASGTGKSSLVRAGLLPRLANGAIEGSWHWPPVVAFTPGATGNDPFLALAVELHRVLPPAHGRRPADIAKALAGEPQRLLEHAADLLSKRPAGAALVLFVDQLEELFTLAAEKHRGAFVEVLARAAGDPRLRVLVTLRADFLQQAMAFSGRIEAEPALAPLLQAGGYLLGPPGPAALLDMIRRPAERAGLNLNEGLADEILRDAGGDAGEALPLVAFCLEELHRRTAPEHHLTLDAYRAIGGLRGVIGRRAGELLEVISSAVGADLDTALPRLFRALVHVDAAGKAARQRASWDTLMSAPAPVPQLTETLINGRLLLAGDAGNQAAVTLAHEALLQEWPALREWLEYDRDRMQRVQRHLLYLAAPDASDRQHSAEALGRIGPAAAEAVPALATTLGSAKEEDVRCAAAEALGRIGPAAAVAMSALLAALRDPEKKVRRGAAEAFGRIGPAATEAVPALAANLHEPGEHVRWSAATALGGSGQRRPRPCPHWPQPSATPRAFR